MSVAAWICITFLIADILLMFGMSWYADRYRDERQENERLRSLLEMLGCPGCSIMRLVPLQDERERARLRGHKCGNAKTD